MTAFRPRQMIAAAAFIAFTAASSAMAATVTYTTTGTFLSSGTAAATVGTSTLTFAGTAQSTSLTGILPALFGSFTLATTSVGGDTFNDTFTLNISQTSPSVGNTNSSAQVTGTVSTTPGSGVIIFNFNSPVSIGTSTYSLPNLLSVTIPNVNPIELTGTLSNPGGAAAPLPAAASAGTMLMGALGLRRLTRRKVAI